MRKRSALSLLGLALGACGGGAPAPLGYAVPASPSVSYTYTDDSTIGLSLMGQSMSIEMVGRGEYAVDFASRSDGVEVTMRATALDVSTQLPMAATQRSDESDVRGELVFTLDPHGDPTISGTPDVSVLASSMFSRLLTAHNFFPGLPNRVVSEADQWVDTVSFSGDAESGPYAQTGTISYTVVGDTVVAGRALTVIRLDGETEVELTFAAADVTAQVTADLTVDGLLLWDQAAGLMYEFVRNERGSGRARVSVAPVPLPVEIESTRRAVLNGSR